MRIMSILISGFVLFGIPMSTGASRAENPSKKIELAVAGMKELAQSGVRTVIVKPAKSVRETLLSLALKEEYIASESELSWVGNSIDAWEADSTNWGEATMKEAYYYITELEEQYEEHLNEPGNEKEKAKVELDVKRAKIAFKLLLGTGVQFGVVPLGAVQCGVTLAALAIIDPHSGKIYIFSKEDSGGC